MTFVCFYGGERDVLQYFFFFTPLRVVVGGGDGGDGGGFFPLWFIQSFFFLQD